MRLCHTGYSRGLGRGFFLATRSLTCDRWWGSRRELLGIVFKELRNKCLEALATETDAG